MTPNKTIKPSHLDMVMRENDFAIYYQEEILKTKNNNEVAHTDSRLIKHLLLKITVAQHMNTDRPGSYSFFSFEKDFLQAGVDPLRDHFSKIIEFDPIYSVMDPTREQKSFIEPDRVIAQMEDYPELINLMYWSSSVVMKGVRNTFMKNSAVKQGQYKGAVYRPTLLTPEELREKYILLSNQEKAIVNSLCFTHNSGVILPMLLILNQCTPSEYANAVIAMQTSLHTNGYEHHYCDFVPEEIPFLTDTYRMENYQEHLAMLHLEALKSREYLEFFLSHKKLSVTEEIIAKGENDDVEFKSTLRWDLRQDKKNPAMEHACLKTIAAFLNTTGGNLLIGVEDDGNIFGIERDGFENDDKFLLNLWQLIKSSLGVELSPYIKTITEKLETGTVCRVHCKPSPEPVFLSKKGSDDEFYIRTGPASVSLKMSDAIKYIQTHFSKIKKEA